MALVALGYVMEGFGVFCTLGLLLLVMIDAVEALIHHFRKPAPRPVVTRHGFTDDRRARSRWN